MKAAKIVVLFVVALVAVIYAGSRHRTISASTKDPSGKYTAITSYRTYLSLIPMAPGSSSDKPCFVRIVDDQGKDCGEIPVPMLQLSGIEWTKTGASIKLIGEWNFTDGSCYYWSDDQSRKVYVKTKPSDFIR